MRTLARPLFLLAALSCFACTQQPTAATSSAPPPAPAPADSDEPADSGDPLDRVLARSGCAQTTIRDLVDRAAWEAYARQEGEDSPLRGAWWVDDRAAMTLLRRDIEARRQRCELAQDGALPATIDLRGVAPWEALDGRDAVLAPTRVPPLALDRARARQFAEEAVLDALWRERAVPHIAPETVREAYDHVSDTVVLDVIMVPNDPHPPAVSALLGPERDQVEAYYTTHLYEFRLPRRAEIELIRKRVPADARAPDHPDRLALERARDAILAGAPFAELAAMSDDATAADGGRYGVVVPAQFGPLFQLEIGELSEVLEDRQGYYLGRVTAWVEPETQPLDDTLARRIARSIARATVPHPGRAALAAEVQAALVAGDQETLDRLLAEHRLRRVQSRPFPRPDASVPFIGWAPGLGDQLFETLQSPGDVLPEPPLTKNGFAVVQLVSRTRGSDAEFAAEAEAFGARLLEASRERAWRAQQIAWAEEMDEPSLDALRAVLGAAP
jgi:hypothetical protein